MKNEKIKEILKSKKGKVIISFCAVTVLAAAIIAAVAINVNLKPQKEIILKHGTLEENVITASDTAAESSNTSIDNTNSSSSTTTTKTDQSPGTQKDKSSDAPKDQSSDKQKNKSSGKTQDKSNDAPKNQSSGMSKDKSSGKTTNATKSNTSSANKKTSTVKLPTVNTSIPSNYISSSDFYNFYICGKQFKLGQSLSVVLNSGFTTSNNKFKVVAPGESQPAMIFNKSISQTAFCGLTVKNTSNSPKKLIECTIVTAYQNDAYDSHFRTIYFDGMLTKNKLIAALGNPTKIETGSIESILYKNGNRELNFDYLSGKPIYFGISIE